MHTTIDGLVADCIKARNYWVKSGRRVLLVLVPKAVSSPIRKVNLTSGKLMSHLQRQDNQIR